MKILILGAGQVGSSAAYSLAREERNDVTVVDRNPRVLRELQDRLDIRTVEGHASYPDVLAQAGAADADMLIALTDSDEVNMIACEVAHKLFRTTTKIARIRAPEFIDRDELYAPDAIAVDVRISPELLVTQYIKQLIAYPGALQVVDFAEGRVRLVGIRVQPGAQLAGRPIRDLAQLIPDVETRVVAIYRKNSESLIPDGSTTVHANDELFFVAARSDIRKVMRAMRKPEPAGRRIFIAGGGNVGLRLALALESTNKVKIIERNPQRARRISEQLDDSIVLHGDAADEDLLLEENADVADVFCAVTDADEVNILSAMLAKRLGTHRVISLVNRASYAELIQADTIDIAISPQQVTLGALLAYVRRGDVVQVHSLRRGAAEALEAIAHGNRGNSLVVGRTIQEIALPPGTIIGAIVRGDEVMMAHHDTIIESDDHIILFLADRSHIRAVEHLFQVGVTFA